MDGLAGLDPQPFARVQFAMFQQPDPPFGAGIGYIASLGQYLRACLIPY